MRRFTRGAVRSLARAMTVLAGAALLAVVIPASAVTAGDWPAYLHGPMHSSYSSAEKAIRPATVPHLVQKWNFLGDPVTMSGQPRRDYFASPTVADGAVFIGSNAGWFYKLSRTSGAVLDKIFIGFEPKKTCWANGFVDTATVAVDPGDHKDTVYVGGANGYLYALRASNLSLKWKSAIAIPSATTSDYFQWSSPTVANGKIYIGVSSHCDMPLVRGGVIGFRQAGGKKFAEFRAVPKGAVGGSVWSSVAVGPGGDVYATTGNGAAGQARLYHTDSIVQLDPSTLRVLGSFIVPRSQLKPDGDFGGSPTIFGRYVGACNKNGIYYALRRSTMALAWERRIGAGSSGASPAQCTAAAVYNGMHLYFGGPAVKIKGVAYRGSVQERNPANGQLQWETGLPNGVIGSPTMNGGGGIAVGTYDKSTTPNAVYLVDAATGRIVRALITGGYDFAQSVFADGWLFTANRTGVYAWGP